MTIFLRKSTASQEVMLGPFLDDTDGKTAETALSIANTDIKIWKAGATSEVSKNSGGATHIASGRYYCVLDATDTNTLGGGEINVHIAGALPTKLRFCILSAEVYDAFIGGTGTGIRADVRTWLGETLLQPVQSGVPIVDTQYWQGNTVTVGTPGVPFVDIGRVGSSTTAANNLKSAFDGTGYAGGTTKQIVNIEDGSFTNNTPSPAYYTYIENTVWDAATASHVTGGSFGETVGNLGGSENYWIGLDHLSGVIGTNLDATVSSRLPTSSYVAPNNSGIHQVNEFLKNRLDVSTSSRLAASNYIPSGFYPNIAYISGVIAANLDAVVSSRLAASSYTAPNNSGIVHINEFLADRLDVDVSSRMATFVYTAPYTPQQIDAHMANIHGSGSWLANTEPNNSGIHQINEALNDRLDAKISTRMATFVYTTPPTVSQIDAHLANIHGSGSWLTGTDYGTQINNINSLANTNLDATVSSRLPSSSYVAPNNSGIYQVNEFLAERVDVKVSTRLASSSYIAPDNSTISYVSGVIPTISGIVDAIEVSGRKVADLWYMTRQDGNQRQFTANALELGPTGSGTGGGGTATLENQLEIITRLDTNLDATVSSRLSAGDYVTPNNSGIHQVNEFLANRLDAAITSRMATFSYTSPDNAAIASLVSGVNVVRLAGSTQSLTDLKDFADDGYDPSTNFITGITNGLTYSDLASVSGLVTLVKAKTDLIPVDPSKEGSLISLSGILQTLSSLVNTNLDATISSRLATVGYTAPYTPQTIDAHLANIHGSGSWLTGSSVDPTAYLVNISGIIGTNLDTTISSRLATGTYVAPNNDQIAYTSGVVGNLSFGGDATLVKQEEIIAIVTHNSGAIANISTGGGSATIEKQNEILAAISGIECTGGSSIGNGSILSSVTVKDGGGNTLNNSLVTLSLSEIERYNVYTNSSGVAFFSLIEGAWNTNIYKEGYHHNVPDTFNVSGVRAVKIVNLDQIAITPPTLPATCTGYLTVVDQNNIPESGVTISISQQGNPATSGVSYDSGTRREVSNASGIVMFTNMTGNAEYHGWRGKSSYKTIFTTPYSGIFPMPAILGIRN